MDMATELFNAIQGLQPLVYLPVLVYLSPIIACGILWKML